MSPGGFTSPWYQAVAARGDLVAVRVSGDLEAPNGLDAELQPPGGGVRRIRLTQTTNDLDAAAERRRISHRPVTERRLLPIGRVGAAGRVRVRLTAVGAALDPRRWMAFSAPSVLRTASLRTLMARANGPVLTDWNRSMVFPCARIPRVRNGLLQPPALAVTAAGLERSPLVNPLLGSLWAPVAETAAGRPRFSYLRGEERETTPWAVVERLSYREPANGFDLTPGTRVRSGLWRAPRLSEEAYTGRRGPTTRDW